jgi:prepilin-type N-terminal cleavage/methylation domain-containing protein
MNKVQKNAERGFSLIELMVVCLVLVIVLGGVFRVINHVMQRSQVEQVKVDLTQQAREFWMSSSGTYTRRDIPIAA